MRKAVSFLTLIVLALSVTGWQAVGPVQPQNKKSPAKQAAPPSGPQPKITLSSELWDFGEVLYGDAPQQKFTIKNEGDADLIIDRVRGSCTCTVPKLTTKLLKPGESTEVTVNFNTKKRQGKISTVVQVSSNDPLRRVLTYRVQGTVKRLIDFRPTSVQLRGLKRDEVMSATVKIVNQGSEPIKPTIKSNSSDYFDVEIKEIEAGQVYELLVKTKPPIPYGTTRAGIVISTGSSRQPTIKVPVNANVRARVSVTPPIIFVPKQTKAPSTRPIRVRYFGTADDFKVLSVESSNPELLSVELKPLGTNKLRFQRSRAVAPKVERVITVKVPAGSELTDNALQVVIRTNDPEFETLVVPVTGDPNIFRKILGLRATVRPTIKPAAKNAGGPLTNPVQIKPVPAKPETKAEPKKADKP